MKILKWSLSIITSLILLQTLYFKFTGAPESIYIFTKIGMEPLGRYLSGAAEMMAGILLLFPSYRYIGAAIALGVISGAIFFHLTSLGIEVQGDGGFLFYLALTVFACSAILLYLDKNKIFGLIRKF